MIQATYHSLDQPNTLRLLSLQEFYEFCDRTEIRYELEDGELIAMPPEPISNSVVSRQLFVALSKYIPLKFLTYKEVFVEVSGRRAKVRVPDLLILGEECFDALGQMHNGTITQDMPPPVVAIEIVSPGHENVARDYRYKRSEYAARGIAEYWIADPDRKMITVLVLVDGFYEESVYRGEEQIESQVFPEIKIKINDILEIP